MIPNQLLLLQFVHPNRLLCFSREGTGLLIRQFGAGCPGIERGFISIGTVGYNIHFIEFACRHINNALFIWIFGLIWIKSNFP